MYASEPTQPGARPHSVPRDSSDTSWHGVAWHGAAQRWPELKGASTGTLGPGTYFASLPDHAAEYGTQLARCDLRLGKPWRIALSYEDPLCEALEFDHPALRAITALHGGRQLIERTRRLGQLHFDAALQVLVAQLGFDSIVGTYQDGSMELVSWHPDQVCIKSWHEAGETVASLLSPPRERK